MLASPLPRSFVALVLVAAARADEPCSEAFEDRIATLEAGRIVLQSGRSLRLADIRLADEGAASRRLAAWRGARIVGAVSPRPDRWGRHAARAVLSEGGVDLAGLLVSDGLAIVDPGEEDALCRRALLASEEEARLARRGIWAQEAPLQATEPDTIAGHVGRFAVVEGRIVSVGERARWTYLNFGRDFSRDFAVSISRRRWDRMKRDGLTAAALKGRRVRVRGIVEMRRAPGMEITTADVIERLDKAP